MIKYSFFFCTSGYVKHPACCDLREFSSISQPCLFTWTQETCTLRGVHISFDVVLSFDARSLIRQGLKSSVSWATGTTTPSNRCRLWLWSEILQLRILVELAQKLRAECMRLSLAAHREYLFKHRACGCFDLSGSDNFIIRPGNTQQLNNCKYWSDATTGSY